MNDIIEQIGLLNVQRYCLETQEHCLMEASRLRRKGETKDAAHFDTSVAVLRAVIENINAEMARMLADKLLTSTTR